MYFLNRNIFVLVLSIAFCCKIIECRDIGFDHKIRSDVIVTRYVTDKTAEGATADEPGLLRRTLLKFGQVASNIGNTMGRHSIKVTSAIEKICEIVKTIVPVISAICGVGQFKFCSATQGVSDDLDTAMHPNPGDLNIPD